MASIYNYFQNSYQNAMAQSSQGWGSYVYYVGGGDGVISYDPLCSNKNSRRFLDELRDEIKQWHGDLK